MNRLSNERQLEVVAALIEDMSINATCRMTGVAKHTVLKLLKELGCAAASYHNDNARIGCRTGVWLEVQTRITSARHSLKEAIFPCEWECGVSRD